MSNSTQNDEIEVEGETYTKWDTQNDEINQMEKQRLKMKEIISSITK